MNSRIEIAKSDEVDEGKLRYVKTEIGAVLLTRVEGEVVAFSNKCPHLGMPLNRGTVESGTVTCPWHGSCFDMRSGENIDWCKTFAGKPMPKWTHRLISLGRRPAPLTLVDVTEQSGKIFMSKTR